MQLPLKFHGIPVEPDTRITSQAIVTAGDIEALHQKWTWEGIRAESLIFPTNQMTVEFIDTDDGGMKVEIRTKPEESD